MLVWGLWYEHEQSKRVHAQPLLVGESVSVWVAREWVPVREEVAVGADGGRAGESEELCWREWQCVREWVVTMLVGEERNVRLVGL